MTSMHNRQVKDMNNEMPFILSAWLQLKADRITVGKGKGKS